MVEVALSFGSTSTIPRPEKGGRGAAPNQKGEKRVESSRKNGVSLHSKSSQFPMPVCEKMKNGMRRE